MANQLMDEIFGRTRRVGNMIVPPRPKSRYDLPLFDRSWRRSFLLPNRAHYSNPAIWSAGLMVDRLVLTLDINEVKTIGTCNVTVQIIAEDSSDGRLWSEFDTPIFELNPSGAYRGTCSGPFGAFVRFKLDIQTDTPGCLALVDGAMRGTGINVKGAPSPMISGNLDESDQPFFASDLRDPRA